MKSKWEHKKLTDVCSIQYGYPFDSSNFSTDAKGMPLVRIRDVMLGVSETYYVGSYPEEYIVHKGDFLIGMDGEFNIAPWKSGDALLNQRVCRITSKGDAAIEFVYRFLLKELKQIEDETPYVTVKHLSAKRLNQVVLPIPPLDEQQRIVAELDLLTEVIDKQKTQLKELDTLAQSIFYDMFGDPIENEKGWSVKKISDVATVKIGPFGSLLHAKDYVKGGHPVINPIHLDSGRVVADDSFTVDETMFQQMLSYELKVNDVVFGRRGDIGRCALVEKEQIGYLCGTGSLFIRFSETIEPKFSIAALMHRSITEYLLKKAKGATMLNINCGIVEDIPLILPPIKLQQEFADKIQSIEKQKAAVNQSIVETQKLLDYTMDKYFG